MKLSKSVKSIHLRYDFDDNNDDDDDNDIRLKLIVKACKQSSKIQGV